MVVTSVHGYPVQPGTERGFFPITVGFAEDGEECLLSGIECRFTIAQHAQTDAKHPILVGAHQFVEGPKVSSQIPPDEVEVFCRTICHLW